MANEPKEEQKLVPKQLVYYREWIKEFESQGLDPTSTSIMKLAREQAIKNRRPPTKLSEIKQKKEASKSFSGDLPWWARIGLKFGGRSVVRNVVGPKGVLTVGVIVVAYATLCSNDVLPHQVCIHKIGVEKLLTEIGLLETAIDGEKKGNEESSASE